MRNPGAKASCRGFLVGRNVTLLFGPGVHFEKSQLSRVRYSSTDLIFLEDNSEEVAEEESG